MAGKDPPDLQKRRRGRPRGRPSELSADVRERIVGALRTSLCSLEDAAWIGGISPRTVHRWRQEGERDDGNGRATPERDFWRETSMAVAEARYVLAGRAFRQSAWDPKLALQILERRDRGTWGQRVTHEHEDLTPPAKSPRDRVLDRLDQMEERMQRAAALGVTDSSAQQQQAVAARAFGRAIGGKSEGQDPPVA